MQYARSQIEEADETVEEEDINRDELRTKTSEREYTGGLWICVMELAGLEVATGKIGQVMEAVGAFCGVKFECLPSRTACQRIVDEGHELAKTFVSQMILRKCKGFGIHKDDTLRRKVKILDTSISTDSGESFCLGWSSVVSETGQAIGDDTIEVVEDEEDGMLEAVQKMEYVMNDRAANEKKRVLCCWMTGGKDC